jgi:hypothetical protein
LARALAGKFDRAISLPIDADASRTSAATPRSVAHLDTDAEANVRIKRALISILEASPAAYIINKDSFEPRIAAFAVGEHLPQCVSILNAKSTFAVVSVSADDFEALSSGVLGDQAWFSVE